MKVFTAIYTNFIGKGDFTSPSANSDFQNLTLSVQEFANHISLGQAFSPQLKDGKRLGKNFEQANWLGLDFDSGFTLEEAMSDLFIQKFGTIIYTTVNHQKEKLKGRGKVDPACDRLRVIFLLENPITDPEEYKAACRGLFKRYPQADHSTGDPARLFCGSKDCILSVFENNFLNDSLVKTLIQDGQINRIEPGASPWIKGSVPSDEIRKMLRHIPQDAVGNIILKDVVGHAAWIRIVFAVASVCDPDTAFNLISEWSPDDKGGSYTQTLIDKADGSITLGTLIYHAEQNGYRLPQDLERKRFEKGRTAGQVILEDLLDGGLGLVTITGELYQYDGKGLYVPMNQNALEAKVLKYFNTYQTNKKGQNAYATAKYAEAALRFILGICKPEEGVLINPPGHNFKNGYLRISYDFQGQPIFELLPHSLDTIFTYRAEVDWQFNPSEADLDFFDKAFADILPNPEEQKILIRTIAACLDMSHVRANLKSGRTVKALILEGEGANGKDTIRAWTQELFGNQGLADVSIRAFKDADEGKLFEMVPLATCKLNWSSEDSKVNLDGIEILKSFITGDSGVKAARKHKDVFSFHPNAGCIFNMNNLPASNKSLEAISSRFNIIRFTQVFVAHPDQSNPRHRQGDARFKDNKQFIRERILPGFAYRIMQAYKDLLREGIDYSSTEHHLKEVREDSNHLIRFWEDQNLEACPVEQGMLVSQCFEELYIPWAKGEGFIEENPMSFNKTIHHPHETYDRLITHSNGFSKRLKETFSDIELKRTKKGTRIGLKSVRSPLYPYQKSTAQAIKESMGGED